MLPDAAELGVHAGQSLGELIVLVGKISEPGSPVLVQIEPYDDFSDWKSYLFRSTTPNKIKNETLGETEIVYLYNRRVLRLYTTRESGFFVNDDESRGEAFVFEKGIYVLNDAVQTFESGVFVKFLEVAEIARHISSEVKVLAGEGVYDFLSDPVLYELDI